jgi:hypothetical protein
VAHFACSYDAVDSAAPLYFTEKAKGSRFFGSMRPEIVADLAAKPYARESHSRGLSLKDFDASAALKEEYEVLSLSTDPEGEVHFHCAAELYVVSVTYPACHLQGSSRIMACLRRCTSQRWRARGNSRKPQVVHPAGMHVLEPSWAFCLRLPIFAAQVPLYRHTVAPREEHI